MVITEVILSLIICKNLISGFDAVSLIDSTINIDNFIDYLFIQIFTCNTDWPHNNMRIWNAEEMKRKWEWIAYDFDFTFCDANTYSDFFTMLDTNNMLDQDKYNVFLTFFKFFIKNTTLKNRMFSRIQDLLNYDFKPENSRKVLDKLISQKEDLLPKQLSRWPNSLQNYNQNIEDLKTFIQKRPLAILMNAANTFFSNGLSQVTIKANIDDAGKFDINSNKDIEGIDGLFFRELPITVIAKPNEGYKFVGWSSGGILHRNKFYPDLKY